MSRDLIRTGVAVIVALMVPLMVMLTPASASPVVQETRGPFYSYFQIQAVAPGETNIVIEYVDGTGTIVDTDSLTLTQGNSQIFYQSLNENLPSGFQGSVVISSDQEVAVFSSATDYFGYKGQAGCEAVMEPSNDVLLPLIMRHYSAGWYTRFAVQNTSASGDAHVTIRYYADQMMGGVPVGTPVFTETATIPHYASHLFDQSALTDAQLPWGFKGSVTITSTQPVVAEVLQWQSGNSRLQSYNGMPPSAAAQRFYVPLNMKNYSANWYTYIQVQNVDVSAAAHITITYNTTPTPIVFTDTVQTSQTYYASLVPELPNGWLGSAVVEADRNILVISGEAQNHPTKHFASTIYNAFSDADGATEFNVPIAMKNFSAGWYTHLVIQSLDLSVTNPITITYSNGTEFTDTLDATKPSGIYYTALDPNLPSGFLGAATVTSEHPVVVIIGSNSSRYTKGDWASRFRAIRQTTP